MLDGPGIIYFNISMVVDMIKDATVKKESTDRAKEMAALFKVLAEENRLKIVACLAGGEKCVCQLTEAIDIPQNLMSHHLKVLRQKGLIVDERRGQWVYYSLKTTELKELFGNLEQLCDCSIGKTC